MLIETLILAAALATPGEVHPPEPPRPLLVQDAAPTYDSLLAEFEVATAAWRERLKAADGTKARRAVRDAHPAREFAPRFEALATAGEGRALLWRSRHLRELGLGSKERGAELRQLYAALIADHAGEPWMVEVPAELYRNRRHVGEGEALDLLARLDADGVGDEARAAALAALVSLLERSDAEGSAERIAAIENRLEEEFGNTRAGMAVRAKRASARTQPGSTAPDFKGSTIDGFQFELSEYRGKVVLLDFYGFW